MRLVAETVSVERGEDLIVAGVSFAVSSGQALIVTGPNGSGKSSLLRAMAGLIELRTGSIVLDQAPEDFRDVPFSNCVHFLGHENAMKPQMTVAENLDFWQRFCGHPECEVDEALEFVGLSGLDDVPFAHLSTGQRRRASIARLLVSARPVWLLDEPTAGLDAASERQFAGLMESHLKNGGIIVAATHVPLHLDQIQAFDLGPYSARAVLEQAQADTSGQSGP